MSLVLVASGTTMLGALVAVEIAAAPLAAADPVSVSYSCDTSVNGQTYSGDAQSYTLTVTAPTTAAAGSSIQAYWVLTGSPTNSADATTSLVTTTQPTITTDLNGSPASAVTTTSNPSDPTDIETGDPIPMAHALIMPITLNGSAGDVYTLLPGSIRINFVSDDGDFAGGYAMCQPSDPPVAATITLTSSDINAPADCSGGSKSVAASSCTSASSFDQTDPSSSGSLQQQLIGTGTNPDASSVQLGSVTTSATPQTLTGPLNTVNVTDSRGGTYGWILTAQMVDPMSASGSGATIPASAVTLSGVTCAPTAGQPDSAPAVVGTGGTLDSSVTLCSVEAGSTGGDGTSNGDYDVDANVSLTVPAFQSTGEYSGTIILTLS